jgi:RNA polymerase sigma-70 factor (ECF subfamily)
MTDATADELAGAFERQRSLLLGIAYRMLGSFADAEDVVQDAFLRWRGQGAAAIENPRAFLATVVTRLCLDRLRSARRRRETYVGSWLPEPIVAPFAADDAVKTETVIDAPVALMLALERLSPLERAVFILHDLIDLELPAVAAAIGRSDGTCRQLLARGRTHVSEDRRRYPVDPVEGRRVAAAFFQAISTGQVEPLRALLAEAATLTSDGGGKVVASLNVIRGGDRVFRFYEGVAAKWPREVLAWSGIVAINGQPGFVSRDSGGIVQTVTLDVRDGRIAAIYVVRNPDKLARAAAFAVQPLRHSS